MILAQTLALPRASHRFVRVPHLYQADASPPEGDVQYTDVQWPDDASINGYIATVVRTSPPAPVSCELLVYDGFGDWNDGGPSTIGWTDEGPAPS